MMNALKQAWKDFMIWLVWDNGYSNLKIDECNMTFITYFKTKARHDIDNCVPKFMLDGLVDSGFIVDDNSDHLKCLTLKCDYDRENPRTEILISGIK
jgi:Holliday junction resolvase RusA-like endonuclease